MNNKKYIFIGNRFYVLKKMQELGCNIVKIYAVKNSFLEKYLKKIGKSYEVITSKKDLINQLKELEFDYLISNGCPYILPISKLKKENQEYINIHPSLLPDLKGKHPINGAILYSRKHGVTCHHMDDGIDTGKPIVQIEISIDDKMSLALLYQISFQMEGKVFEKAFYNNFEEINNTLYYSRKLEDLYITQKDNIEVILKKIKAFGIKGLYAKFINKNKEYCCINANLIISNALNILYGDTGNNKIILIYEDYILVKYDNNFIEIQLDKIDFLEEGEQFL